MHASRFYQAALKLSAFAARDLAACSYQGVLELNLVPELSREEVAEALTTFKARAPLTGGVYPVIALTRAAIASLSPARPAEWAA